MVTAAKTKIVHIDKEHPDLKMIAVAVTVLRGGGLVAFPTETVYGLGADAFNKEAVEKIYEAKQRPRSKPLTLHVSGASMMRTVSCDCPPLVERLLGRFWPGPLTVIVRSKTGANVGFRMPRHIVALRLIEAYGSPLVAPSANTSGKRPPTDAAMVLEDLNGKIDLLLDAGVTALERESTVVDMTVTPPGILREGAITASEILKVIEGHGN